MKYKIEKNAMEFSFISHLLRLDNHLKRKYELKTWSLFDSRKKALPYHIEGPKNLQCLKYKNLEYLDLILQALDFKIHNCCFLLKYKTDSSLLIMSDLSPT